MRKFRSSQIPELRGLLGNIYYSFLGGILYFNPILDRRLSLPPQPYPIGTVCTPGGTGTFLPCKFPVAFTEPPVVAKEVTLKTPLPIIITPAWLRATILL